MTELTHALNINFRFPFAATGYGDPHFRTMDGTEFTYNGKGEYWLLRTRTQVDGANPLSDWDHVMIQVRLEQPDGYMRDGGCFRFTV